MSKDIETLLFDENGDLTELGEKIIVKSYIILFKEYIYPFVEKIYKMEVEKLYKMERNKNEEESK